MSIRKHHLLAAAVLSAAMLCSSAVCAWASSTGSTVSPTSGDAAIIKTALASGLEAMGQKPELPRLLPSDTKVKAVGRITEKDFPLYFDPTEESNVYILLPEDALVSVMEDLEDWFRISYNDCTGFVPPEYVELLKLGDSFETYGVIDAEEVSLLKEADGESEVLATLKEGDRVEVSGFDNGWYAVKIGDLTGYVTGDDLDLTMEKEAPKPVVKPAEKKESAKAESTDTKTETDSTETDGSMSDSATDNSTAASGSGSAVVAFAQQYLGVPYAYGGTGPYGFDCSGFTMHVYANFGVSLAHGATPQLNSGYSVSKSELQPGDLVFFFGTYNTSSAASHVGVYVGDGQFIHASSSRGVIISSLSETYYANRYLAARRVF